MADSSQTKSEAASPRRREDARKRGQVASSHDLTSAIFLLFMFMLVSYTSSDLGNQLVTLFRRDLPIALQQDEWSVEASVYLGRASGLFIVGTASVILGGGFVFALIANLVQVGVHLSPEALALKPSRLSPANGAKRIFSFRGAMRTGVAISKFVAISAAIASLCFSRKDSLLSQHGTLANEIEDAWATCLLAGIVGAVALVAIGAVDFAFQRWQHDEDLKMSKQEVKEESKESEGDPHMKGRIRKLQAESAKMRSINDVPKATVVITNPTHLAIAIQYDRATMSAPKVVAKGKGIMAKRIRRRAEEAGIPILERKPIARALYASAEIGSEIPTSLYRAVAEILAHVYKLPKGR